MYLLKSGNRFQFATLDQYPGLKNEGLTIFKEGVS
jgi:hypothetical protein